MVSFCKSKEYAIQIVWVSAYIATQDLVTENTQTAKAKTIVFCIVFCILMTSLAYIQVCTFMIEAT